MARLPRVLLILHALPIIVAKTTLSTDLTNVIPLCARDCFTSFLDFNFALGKCGINPTLDCLCTTKSITELTVGEGALQCIFTVDGCVGMKDSGELETLKFGSRNADEKVVAVATRAYSMCAGRPSAIPNTHATITATRVAESSSITVSSTRSTTSSSETVDIITRITTSSGLLPSTLITATQSPPRQSSPALQTSTSASAQIESQTAAPISSGINLTREQTIGISVGTGVGAVAIIFLIAFACWRRRRAQRSRDSDMLPFQMDPTNALNYRHHGGLGGFVETKITGPAIGGKKAPRIPPRLDTSSPNMFSRRSIKPEQIGVAISPEGKYEAANNQRRKSKLLPEKPSLKVTVPPTERLALNVSQNPNKNGCVRQSTATQFEEDFDSADTAVNDDSWIIEAKGQVLEVPPGNVATIRKVTPEPNAPAPAFLITSGSDGNHWRPGRQGTNNMPVQPEYQVKPLNITHAPVGSFSQPRRPDEYPPPARILNYQHPAPQQQGQPPKQQSQKPSLSVVVPNRNPARPLTNTSSIYSSSLPSSATANRPESVSRPHRSYNVAGPYDRRPSHQSSGSLTSFETLDSAVSTENMYAPPLIQSQPQSQTQRPVLAPINTNTFQKTLKPTEKRRTTMLLDLSPVVESPARRSPRSPTSAKGVSPVSYPKIPKQGRLPENTIRMVPPPAQPDFRSVFSSGRTVSQRRRTLNADGVSPEEPSATPIDTATGTTPVEASMKPWRLAEIRAQRERERAVEEQNVPEKRHTRSYSESEARSADIEIRMISPEVLNSLATQQQHQRPYPAPQQRNERMQPFLLGRENASDPFGPSTGSSSTLPNPPRIQPQLLPQQRRTQQQQQQSYQPQNPFFPTQQRSQSNLSAYHQNQKLPLQQQLAQSYQAFNPSLHGRNQPRSSTAPLPQSNQQNTRFLNPQITHTRSSSVSSTTSSLLAKRRGEGMERGMALNLPQSSSTAKVTQGQKWRVLDEGQKQMAKSGDWRPKLANGNGGGGGGQVVEIDGKKERELNGGGQYLGTGDLPKTPGWVPKLTPTRRGDELFLSVA